MVHLRYWRIHLTTLWWDCFRECIYRQILFTAKEMSGCVNDKFWRLPTILWYKVLSSKLGESNLDSLSEGAIGVVIGLARSMLLRRSKLWLYLIWESNKPFLVWSISTPKKYDKLSRSLTGKAWHQANISASMVNWLEVVMTISLMYTRKNIRVSAYWRMKREGLTLEELKP